MIDPPVATSLGLPEGYVEALGTSRQSSARMTPPIYSNSYMHISQSSSMSALDSTLNVGGESRAEISSSRKQLSRDLKVRLSQM